ncbi:GntR family transcriptional regulator [Geodermatophilus normandii]|uniref:GntR family transcriptional regulator n=1 Tax=Geodermatophilus normandii TaxID=1137989 RepID=A0A6P0GII7_9ACTN|nr:GntR family transcriptional regulator [Geodermatophilus normandii]
MSDAAVTLSGGAVVSSTRREEVSARIRRALLTGELRPGQRIKEVGLAEALGVSRPTLRESLQQLIHEGSLVHVPYKGIHVAAPTPEELRDVAEVRMPLETMAAIRLSHDPHGSAMDGVREALEVHLAAIGSGDALEAHVTHLALHKAIWDQAASPTLTKIWPLVGSQIHIALSVDQAVRHDPERDVALHRRLVRVIEQGDEAAIAAEVEEHIRRSVDEVLRRLP